VGAPPRKREDYFGTPRNLADVINRTQFHVHWLKVFDLQMARVWDLPLESVIAFATISKGYCAAIWKKK
jgi:hypothetical protein